MSGGHSGLARANAFALVFHVDGGCIQIQLRVVVAAKRTKHAIRCRKELGTSATGFKRDINEVESEMGKKGRTGTD